MVICRLLVGFCVGDKGPEQVVQCAGYAVGLFVWEGSAVLEYGMVCNCMLCGMLWYCVVWCVCCEIL